MSRACTAYEWGRQHGGALLVAANSSDDECGNAAELRTVRLLHWGSGKDLGRTAELDRDGPRNNSGGRGHNSHSVGFHSGDGNGEVAAVPVATAAPIIIRRWQRNRPQQPQPVRTRRWPRTPTQHPPPV